MRNLTDKEAVELLDQLSPEKMASVQQQYAEEIMMSFLRGNGYGKVAEAYEAARDRVGFWCE